MALTRQEDFIQFIEEASKKGAPDAKFLDDLRARVNELVSTNIDWGASTFTSAFSEKLLKNSLIAEQAIFVILNGLLENRRPFDEGPLRQPHLFSHLYGELLKRNVVDLSKENAAMPDDWHALNRKMLQLYIKMLPKKGAEEATYACINNFLYMRFQGLDVKKEGQDNIQKLFFEDVKACIQENDIVIAEMKIKSRMEGFVSKPNTPIPQRKQPEPPKVPAPDVRKEKKSQQADPSITDALRRQYRGNSAQGLFKKKPEKPGKARSADGRLENTDHSKTPGRGSSK